MKFQDLIHKHPWPEIHTALVRLYPDHESEIEGYQTVFEKLKKLTPLPTDLRLRVELVYSEHSGEFHIEAKGIGPSQENGDTGSLFALEFTPWVKWLGMELDTKTLDKFSEFDIVAHCLYEMTFFGFTQEDIKTAEEELMESGIKD
jgi:hypothetical protein